jgi:TolB-like protein
MASIIPDYEYDIFVSYRQKDNKYDGWVTEFVNNLNKELEATFKEEVSVYFDINPHDGLLETHDVDASLKEKLKCLVFIPIISRTYCDPKSFAWEHEFKAFITQSCQDKFGLKVKLPGGNVAGRVLPVRIHDLDESDYKLVESVLGGVLRSIEFVYKSAGVNRPLRSNEDHPQDNLNNTYYRDQINKVANSVDEIISSLKKGKIPKENDNILTGKPELVPISKQADRRRRLMAGRVKSAGEQIPRLRKIFKLKGRGTRIALILSVLLIAGLWYFWPFLINPRIIPKDFESSVALMSFDDISEGPGFENFATGATNDLISRLSRIANLKVVPVNRSSDYLQSNISTKSICKDNAVKMVLQGSVKADAENITLTSELIDGEKDVAIWKQSKTGKLENILAIQDEIATEVARAINVKYSSSQVQKQLSMRPTKNFKAYELFLKGNAVLTKWNYEGLKESLTYYNRALEIDKDFIEALSNSALANLLRSYFFEYDRNIIETIKKDAKKALSLEKDNEVALMCMEGYYIMKILSGQRPGIFEYRDIIINLRKLIIKNPSSPMAFLGLAEYYRLSKKDLDKAAVYFRMALTQSERLLQSDPSNGIILGIAAQSAGLLGQIEFKSGNFLNAIKNTEYSIRLLPGISRTYIQLSNFYFDTDQPQRARAVLDQAISNVNNDKDRGYIELIQGRYSMVEAEYSRAEKYWADAMTHLVDPGDPFYDYALLYRYVMLYKLANSTSADTLIRNRLKTPGINSWPEPIISFFYGNILKDDLIRLAQKGWQKCEAFFFLGEKELMTGNLSEAKKLFEACINTKETNYLEYDMSQAELHRTLFGK